MPKSNHRREVEEFLTPGAGGATHQSARSAEQILTTNQGTAVSDNQRTLKSGERGPSLLEDFHFREKISITSIFRSESPMHAVPVLMVILKLQSQFRTQPALPFWRTQARRRKPLPVSPQLSGALLQA